MLALILVWLTLRSLFEVGTIDLDRPNGSGPSVNRPYLNRLTGIWPLFVGVILGLGLAAPAWLSLLDYVHGSARQSLDPAAHWQWLVPWKAWPGLILPPWTVNWSNFLTKLEPHRAAELACGLIAPAALLAGLVVNSRALLKKIGWELALLLVVFILAMVPTAGVFLEFPLAPTLASRPRPLRRRSPRIILAKTTTFCRLPPPHIPTLAHQHRRKNPRRTSLPTRLDLPRSRARLANRRIDRI